MLKCFLFHKPFNVQAMIALIFGILLFFFMSGLKLHRIYFESHQSTFFNLAFNFDKIKFI